MLDEQAGTQQLEEGQVDEGQHVEEQSGGAADPNAELRSAMQELAGSVKTIADKQGKETEHEPTEQEKKEFWAIYDPEQNQKEFFRKWFRLNPEATQQEVDEVKGLFADVQKGIVKQAVVGARNLVSVEIEKLREEFKGISDYMAERKAKETRDAFNETYPVLADKKYDKIVALSAKNLDQSKFKSQDEYFKALAESAAETISAATGQPLDLGAEQPKKTAATTPRLNRTSAGGTGGSGKGATPSGGGGGKSQDDTDSLLD
jgi:hypothetical protein